MRIERTRCRGAMVPGALPALREWAFIYSVALRRHAERDFQIVGDGLRQRPDRIGRLQVLGVEILRPALPARKWFDEEDGDAGLCAGRADGDGQNHCGAGRLCDLRGLLVIAAEREDRGPADHRDSAAIGDLGSKGFAKRFVGWVEAGWVHEGPTGGDDG